MTPEDRKMYEKGYRYRCIPSDKSSSPYMDMYAKDMEMVSILHRDWPAQRFNVVKLVCWLDEAITSILNTGSQHATNPRVCEGTVEGR